MLSRGRACSLGCPRARARARVPPKPSKRLGAVCVQLNSAEMASATLEGFAPTLKRVQ